MSLEHLATLSTSAVGLVGLGSVSLLGLSIRDLQENLFMLIGQVLSRSAINPVTLRVEQRVQQYRNEPVSIRHQSLWLIGCA
jgi:hypothetical protein